MAFLVCTRDATGEALNEEEAGVNVRPGEAAETRTRGGKPFLDLDEDSSGLSCLPVKGCESEARSCEQCDRVTLELKVKERLITGFSNFSIGFKGFRV